MLVMLTVTMGIASLIPLSANNSENFDELNLENYFQYTINFDEKTRGVSSETGNNIEAAIEYVESLNLKDLGFSHIEEACLIELESYSENNVILESYTVLVPKTRETEYFGTYLGNDFYGLYLC